MLGERATLRQANLPARPPSRSARPFAALPAGFGKAPILRPAPRGSLAQSAFLSKVVYTAVRNRRPPGSQAKWVQHPHGAATVSGERTPGGSGTARPSGGSRHCALAGMGRQGARRDPRVRKPGCWDVHSPRHRGGRPGRAARSAERTPAPIPQTRRSLACCAPAARAGPLACQLSGCTLPGRSPIPTPAPCWGSRAPRRRPRWQRPRRPMRGNSGSNT
jgi:hypothetical protein